jgi:hypothetical protein
MINWNKTIFKNTIFLPNCRNESQIDKFILNLFNQELLSLKSIYHSL